MAYFTVAMYSNIVAITVRIPSDCTIQLTQICLIHGIIGKGPRQVILPTRHLQLLKHIKISVMSGSPHIGQDQWVADLVKQFAKEGLRLETFEMTWFGWKRYHLRADGLVCQALLCLDVERHLAIKVTGEARMDKEMEGKLERTLRSKRVEVHRPVKPTGEEMSDEDEAQAG